jgi:signal transduction histidine kinase
MNYFSTAPLIAAAGNLLLAIFVLLQAPGQKLNRVFFLFGISISIWTFGAFMMFQVSTQDAALLWTRLLHMGVILLPITLFDLSMRISRSPLLKYARPLYWLGCFFLILDATPFLIRDVRYVGYGYFGIAGSVYWLFSLTIPSLSIPSLFILLKRRQGATSAQRHRLSLLIAAILMLFFFGLHDVGPMFGVYYYPGTQFPVYPLGTAAALVYGALVAYSVLQHQLLDVRLALGRVAATFTRLIFFCAIGFMLVFVLALAFPEAFTLFSLLGFFCVLTLSGLISSILFPRLLGGSTETLERRILGDRFEYRDQIKSFIDHLPQYRLIPPMLDDLTSLLSDTVKISRIQITLYTPSTREVAMHHTAPGTLESTIEAPPYDGPLLQLIRQNTETRWFDFSDLPVTATVTKAEHNPTIQEKLADLAPTFCFPLRSADDISGVVILGAKSDQSYYTAIDLDVLAELFGQVSILIDQIHLKDQVGVTEKLESLAIMSRGLAHDLNNLLTPINTYIQLTGANANPDDPENELLAIASKNLIAIKTYVREAVFFSTTLAPKLTPISIKVLLDDLAGISLHQLNKGNVSLILDIPEHFVFQADSILLQRLLSNLVFNAIDASPSGSSITVRAVQLPRMQGRARWMRLQVIDQGSGISRENLNRVFAPYFTTKNIGDQMRGFGLGLTICQKIVHLHRGTITLHSTEGKGTTVQIDLPTDPVDPSVTVLPS